MDDIEEFGCFILHIGTHPCELDWTYTIGLVDTKAGPEIIAVGLPYKTAKFALNEAGTRLRAGVDLSVGRHADLIANVDCEFRLVARKWVKSLMPWADWYYDREDFPVLQLVYPDLQNRFPGEAGFESRFAQPRLQPDILEGKLEKEFWDANEGPSEREGWPFPDPLHKQVYLTQSVFNGSEVVTFVSHDADDGAWQFLGDSMSDGGDPVLVCLHQMVDRDPTLLELADLPKGWYAERNHVGEEWVRRQREDLDE